MQSFFRCLIPLVLCVLLVASGHAQPRIETPTGGNPLPWSAVSIHLTDPDNKNWRTSDQANGITDHGMSVQGLISQAYNFNVTSFRDDEIEGLPAWAKTVQYDVVARVDPDDSEAFHKLSNISMEEAIAAFAARQSTGEMLMEQALLADRFHLKAHWEQRERNVYVLTVAKGGVRMSPVAADPRNGEMLLDPGKLSGKGIPLSFLASLLALPAQRTVIDHTGLKGQYDFKLNFAPPEATVAGGTSTEPDFFTAVQEQLGLKLQSGKAKVPVLVIDHVEPPTPN